MYVYYEQFNTIIEMKNIELNSDNDLIGIYVSWYRSLLYWQLPYESILYYTFADGRIIVVL